MHCGSVFPRGLADAGAEAQESTRGHLNDMTKTARWSVAFSLACHGEASIHNMLVWAQSVRIEQRLQIQLEIRFRDCSAFRSRAYCVDLRRAADHAGEWSRQG